MQFMAGLVVVLGMSMLQAALGLLGKRFLLPDL